MGAAGPGFRERVLFGVAQTPNGAVEEKIHSTVLVGRVLTPVSRYTTLSA